MGGLTQLISIGASDIFLTGEPTKSLWKRNAVRKTPFAIESIETVFDPVFGAKSYVNVKKAGDLLKSCMLEITLKRSSIESFYPAEQLVKSLNVTIGGQDVQIIEDFPTWCRVQDELFNNTEVRSANFRMMNFRPDDPVGAERTFYLKLPLFFSEHVSKSLPIVALQYQDIVIQMNLQNPSEIPGIDHTFTPVVKFYGDYVFLDKPERTYFAQNQHEYIIEQLQTFLARPNITGSLNTTTVDLPFNLPTRYLVWVYKSNLHGVFTTSNNTFENNEAYAPMYSAVLKLNGTDRFSERPGGYFNLVQPVEALGQAPSVGIYMYSFGINADQVDSEGTLNCSAIDMVTLSYTNKAAVENDITTVTELSTTLSSGLTKFTDVVIFAKNFNVLRVEQGMAGVLFSN